MSFQDTLETYHFSVPADTKFIPSFAYTASKKDILLDVLDEIRHMGGSKELRLEVLTRYSDEYAKSADDDASSDDGLSSHEG